MTTSEYILCAAISKPNEYDMAAKPLIYCGHRHNNILWQGRHVPRSPRYQGFLTSTGRFVDRKEAYMIAVKAKQIVPVDNVELLYSEDLY